jgi:hypothetical protein
MPLTTEELLAGSTLIHEVKIPAELLSGAPADAIVLLRPLNVQDLQRIAKAAKNDSSLSAALIIQHAMASPTMKLEEIVRLPAGLARFLVDRINAISGIDTPRSALQELVQAPLAKACFILAKEFGWTPEEVSGMTIGQILLYLEMIREEGSRK